MAFHQTMQWRDKREMKLGGKMVPDSRDLEDYSEEANLALIRGWRHHFEQVNSIMGKEPVAVAERSDWKEGRPQGEVDKAMGWARGNGPKQT